jgi:hypothetical protein
MSPSHILLKKKSKKPKKKKKKKKRRRNMLGWPKPLGQPSRGGRTTPFGQALKNKF